MPHIHRKQHQRQQQTSTGKECPDLGFLFFKADGSQVTIQHCSSHGDGTSPRPASVPSLRVDLRSSKVWVGPAAPLPNDSPMTLGIVGLLRLERGSILVLVSKAKRVCGMLDGPVYKVEDTTLVAPEAINNCPNDLRYASLLQEAFNPKCFGSHLYFSHTANITSSRQRQALSNSINGVTISTGPGSTALAVAPGGGGRGGDGGGGGGLPSLDAWWDDTDAATTAAGTEAGVVKASSRTVGGGRAARSGGGSSGSSGSLWSRADPRFVWNGELMRPLIEAGGEFFAMPVMAGYIGQATGATFQLRSNRDNGKGEGDDVAEAKAKVVAHAPGELSLITRWGVERPVAGGWRRGLDMQGHAAGFAETEVILTVWKPEQMEEPAGAVAAATATATATAASSPPTTSVSTVPEPTHPRQHLTGTRVDPGCLKKRTRVAVASYVMARGSTPLCWAAPPDLRPCPAPRAPEDSQTHSGPFVRHVEQLYTAYGKSLLLLNVIFGAAEGRQLRIHDALKQQVDSYKNARTRRTQQLPQEKQVCRVGEPTMKVNSAEKGDSREDLNGADADAHASEIATPGGDIAPPGSVSTAAGDGKSNPCEGTVTATAAAGSGDSSGEASAADGGGSFLREAAPGSLTLVGLLLKGSELSELASCGAAAARLERELAEVSYRIGAFVSLDELEMVVQLQPAPTETSAASAAVGDAAATTNATNTTNASHTTSSEAQSQSQSQSASQSSQPQSLRGRSVTRCVERRVYGIQGGLLRVSSASTASAGGCCEEVDLVQHALALPMMSEVLVAMGGMDDPGDMEAAHASMMHALAHLWSNMADVLSDQAVGTASHAGRLLRAAAAAMEPPSLTRGLLRVPWNTVLSIGDTVSRYYYSNFTDARRQDALDLASGAFKISSPPAELPRRKPPSTTTLQLGLLLLVAATIQMGVLIFRSKVVSFGDLGMGVLGPAALGSLLLMEVLRQGTNYLEQPLLRPDGTYPWVPEI